MIKLLLHESKRRVGSPGVFITPGTYFIISLWFFLVLSPQYHLGLKSSKSVLGREAKSLKNGIPTLCKGLQFNSSASPCRPPKQTNKQMEAFIQVKV